MPEPSSVELSKFKLTDAEQAEFDKFNESDAGKAISQIQPEKDREEAKLVGAQVQKIVEDCGRLAQQAK